MSHTAESSHASRAKRGQSSAVAHGLAFPAGKETGLPLILCPDCQLVRVIELRVKQDTPNKGRSFFKCPRNGNPKECGFFRFQKEYFDELMDRKIIRISCEQIDELEGAEDSEISKKCQPVVGNLDKTKDLEKKLKKKLDKKLDKMMWTMNCFFVCIVIVVLAVVFKTSVN